MYFVTNNNCNKNVVYKFITNNIRFQKINSHNMISLSGKPNLGILIYLIIDITLNRTLLTFVNGIA